MTQKLSHIAAVVLAAGQGTRMKSATPKVLHKVGGLPMVQHVLRTLETIGCSYTCVVTAPSMEDVRAAVAPHATAIQHKAQGTGHAVHSAKTFLEKHKDKNIFVLYGDTPLITAETLKHMEAAQEDATIVLLGMRPTDSGMYGRIFCDKKKVVQEIIEYRDATPEQQENNLCNSGVMLIRGDRLIELLEAIDNKNAKAEYYLTDIVSIARKKGWATHLVETHAEEVLGVNAPAELALVESIFQKRQRHHFLEQGVTLLDPASVYFSYDTEIANDVRVEPHVFFGPSVKVDSHVHIKAFCHIEGAHLQAHSIVGPFARLRPGTTLAHHAKVGNFVEIKNAQIGEHAKVSHLSYIGDATLESHVNIGAGTITCNYDGVKKAKTLIQEGTFVGSNTALVAPVTLGANSIIAAGSVITKDVPEDALAVARGTQETIPNGARKIWARKKKKD